MAKRKQEDTWISEGSALSVLMRIGDYSENQARIILAHSRKGTMMGGTYYPMGYIYDRAQGKPVDRTQAASGSV